MNMHQLAEDLVKRLAISIGAFLVLFVSVCVLYHVPVEDWTIALIAASFWAIPLLVVLVSVIWFVVQRIKRSRADVAGGVG